MIGDETLKKILSTKIHTYIHGRNAPKSKEIFTKKNFKLQKKMKTDFFFPTK